MTGVKVKRLKSAHLCRKRNKMKTMSKKLKIAIALVVALATTMSFKYTAPSSPVFTAPASADAKVNPLKGDAAATAAGGKLYQANCAICHGVKGLGDGVAASGLAKPPANHSSAAVQKLSDGALFWMIAEGNNPMPSYKAVYSETQRWQLVNYIRTLAKPVKK
jgi:mono/diheme cytochrome c family protein